MSRPSSTVSEHTASPLSADFAERLQAIGAAAQQAGIHEITRGIEKESLRVSSAGTLAHTPHPQALGSALTHPQITTDYSEALLEFITPPSHDIDSLLKTLHQVHQFTYQHIGQESLWVNSMPCMLGSDSEIPIAQYGSSNSGRMKSIYRLGLGHRYGRAMQTIAGTHFNFSVADSLWAFLREQDRSNLSLQDYKTQGYFHLIRNFRRYFWLLLYLFGAAPAICRSFVKNREHQLVPIGADKHSLHAPYGTSLRMGNLGYQSAAQESLVITYNCLESYTATLCQAITQNHREYAAIGMLDRQGAYQQLNTSLLQIENEFYSVIRPKRTTSSGQTALNALTTGGVEYIEVRCLDLNPFEPVGISAEQMRFLDTFLLYCLLEKSPDSNTQEHQQIQENQRRMVYQGRDPALMLFEYGQERPARAWGHELIGKLEPIATLLDGDNKDTAYQQALAAQKAALNDDGLTLSARILAEIQRQEVTFYRFAMNAALANRDYFYAHPLDQHDQQRYQQMAASSLADQAKVEADNRVSFDQFLAQYYQQYNCSFPESLGSLAKC